eukprot:5457697-Prorocentrum_lima.AAC.1
MPTHGKSEDASAPAAEKSLGSFDFLRVHPLPEEPARSVVWCWVAPAVRPRLRARQGLAPGPAQICP